MAFERHSDVELEISFRKYLFISYLPKSGGFGVNRTTTIYPHKETYALGNYRGNPFIVGSHSPDNIKTEIMDQDFQWEEAADYPISNSNL